MPVCIKNIIRTLANKNWIKNWTTFNS